MLPVVCKLARSTLLLFEFYQSVAPFDICKCPDGSLISVTVIMMLLYDIHMFMQKGVLEPLFFNILKFFFFMSYFVLQICKTPGPSSCD